MVEVTTLQIVVALWVSLGLTRVMVLRGPLCQQQSQVRFLMADMGLTERQINEAGFPRLMRILHWGTMAMAFAIVPYELIRSNIKFFRPVTEITTARATIEVFRQLIYMQGDYVAMLRKYESEPDDTTHH